MPTSLPVPGALLTDSSLRLKLLPRSHTHTTTHYHSDYLRAAELGGRVGMRAGIRPRRPPRYEARGRAGVAAVAASSAGTAAAALTRQAPEAARIGEGIKGCAVGPRELRLALCEGLAACAVGGPRAPPSQPLGGTWRSRVAVRWSLLCLACVQITGGCRRVCVRGLVAACHDVRVRARGPAVLAGPRGTGSGRARKGVLALDLP